MDKYMEQAIRECTTDRPNMGHMSIEEWNEWMSENRTISFRAQACFARASELRLLDMLRRFTSIIREVTPPIDSMCVFAAVHGQEYSGPQYGPTLAEAEALLDQYKDVKRE